MTLLHRAAAVLPWLLIFTAIYIPARMLTLRRPSRLSREAALWLLWATLVAILSSTLSSDGTFAGIRFSPYYVVQRENYNFIPFKIVKRLLSIENAAEFIDFLLVNIVGNVAIFIPYGFAVRLVSRRGVVFSTLAGAGLSLFAEICQTLTPRFSDVDDLILNTAGALIGALLCLTRFLSAAEPAAVPEPAAPESAEPVPDSIEAANVAPDAPPDPAAEEKKAKEETHDE